MNKKILIISYYWPPAGGPGVQRWLKFTKYLPEFGYEPYVYVPENPSYPIIDTSLIEDINPKVKIIKKTIWEPYQIAEKITKKNKDFKAGQFETQKKQDFLSEFSVFIRGNFFIPDARKFWIVPSVKFLRKFLQKNQINILITTGPPHSMHLIGLKLKAKNPDLKWIADFRDPWTQISYYSELKLTSWADRKHKKLEKEVMTKANVVISTSYTDKKKFEELGAEKVICITNGFDSEITTDTYRSNKFVISYIGMLETLRNPINLWNVLEEMVNKYPDFRSDLLLKFVGKISPTILESIKSSTLGFNTINTGYVSHKEAIEEMKKSNVLLLTNFSEEKSKGIIPGKLFEYLATGKAILSIGPNESDVGKILKYTGAGEHFTYKDKDNLEFFIFNLFNQWKKNISPTPFTNINDFHRKELTKKLVEVIENI